MSLILNDEPIYPRPLSGKIVEKRPPAIVPSRTKLMGDLVTLEPQNAELHGDDLFAAGHSTEAGIAIWDHLTYGPWPDVSSYKAVLRNQSASFDPIFFAIRHHESGQVCGQISIMDINAQNGVFEIGHIWFGPDLQRTRAATEALLLAMDYPMSQLGYRRLQWRCNALNKRSRSAARRLGFRFEGIFYNHLIFKGMNRDTAWYSILDDEWPEVRQNLVNWLVNDNFDAQGVALTSLTAVMKDRQPSTRRQDCE